MITQSPEQGLASTNLLTATWKAATPPNHSVPAAKPAQRPRCRNASLTTWQRLGCLTPTGHTSPPNPARTIREENPRPVLSRGDRLAALSRARPAPPCGPPAARPESGPCLAGGEEAPGGWERGCPATPPGPTPEAPAPPAAAGTSACRAEGRRRRRGLPAVAQRPEGRESRPRGAGAKQRGRPARPSLYAGGPPRRGADRMPGGGAEAGPGQPLPCGAAGRAPAGRSWRGSPPGQAAAGGCGAAPGRKAAAWGRGGGEGPRPP